jgi:hypothetical protein
MAEYQYKCRCADVNLFHALGGIIQPTLCRGASCLLYVRAKVSPSPAASCAAAALLDGAKDFVSTEAM